MCVMPGMGLLSKEYNVSNDKNSHGVKLVNGLPVKQGLYDPRFEHDACGVGFVVHVKGKRTHSIVRDALTVLRNLDHRGAVGAEENTGDGAGILLQIPHEFFEKVTAEEGFELPAAGAYGVGMVYLSQDTEQRSHCMSMVEGIIREEGQSVLGWRHVPTNPDDLGKGARARMPAVYQLFIGRNDDALPKTDDLAFERKLYVIRRRAENAVLATRAESDGQVGDLFYFASLSSRTIVYKGMLLTTQLTKFYPDLTDSDVKSAIAIVHSRFSTNTFPSWERAHPYRYMIHNGEINTLRGNVNWMTARETQLESELWGDDLKKVLPVIDQEGSDSAMFDNALEFLSLSGRSLPHVMMMMIPEPWSNHENMSPERRAFYEYHSTLMEPWDGPASIAFTDGAIVGAVLDRNGLRPSRYYVTKDDMVIMASEVGVLEVEPERVLEKRRLEPGRMFLVDTVEGRIVSDDELKSNMAAEHPYQEWLDEYLIELDEIDARRRCARLGHEYGDPAAAGVRLYVRTVAQDIGSDVDRRCGAGGRNGQRHAAGGAVGRAAATLQLFPSIVRAGYESAHRRHPRGDRDRHGRDDGYGAQLAGDVAGELPADSHRDAGADQQGPGQDSPFGSRALPLGDFPHSV